MIGFWKGMLTESDNETWCVFRFAILVGIIVIVMGHLYATVHYGVVAPSGTFDPEKVADIWKSFTETLVGLMGFGAGSLKMKPKDNATPTS